MAIPSDRVPQNVPGRLYVDSSCIDCDLCRETAPSLFARFDEGGYSYVHHQPTTPEEIALAQEAIEGCPVEAIGNDGDDKDAA
ncbi:ferredoxin [Opitutaceae bacterium EW11]|nr:ferredoxin [Opitutaceae bacterium EW11]